MKRIFFLLLLLGGVTLCAQGREFRYDVSDTGSTRTSRDSLQMEQEKQVSGPEKKKLKIVKREFNFKEQVGLAVGMMAFILIVMTTEQAWNPK
ncbi:MAG: hypothetical protein GF350_02205 [Chitinivibrionales bacterium]|nr:hypothetical protein [Chitinivibrionales bacterium]